MLNNIIAFISNHSYEFLFFIVVLFMVLSPFLWRFAPYIRGMNDVSDPIEDPLNKTDINDDTFENEQ